jgi:predicted transcriptional regulator
MTVQKTALVGVRVSPQTKEQLEDVAWKSRKRVSELVREAIYQIIAQDAVKGVPDART